MADHGLEGGKGFRTKESHLFPKSVRQFSSFCSEGWGLFVQLGCRSAEFLRVLRVHTKCREHRNMFNAHRISVVSVSEIASPSRSMIGYFDKTKTNSTFIKLLQNSGLLMLIFDIPSTINKNPIIITFIV